MEATNAASQEPIAFDWPAFTVDAITAFEKATGSQFTQMAPPTMATLFRWGEFRWLDRLNVDMRHLLHTEQRYEYVSPIQVGQSHRVVTELGELRERRGMRFVTLVSVVSAGPEVRLKSETCFVVRPAEVTPK